MPLRYKAFLSYSHAADGKLAPALQKGLERFAKPWYRLRALRVFRDKTGLAVTPELWGSIQRALEDSEYFILLASPAAAQSKWVHQEVEFWLQHRSADTVLIALTDGVITWDAPQGDFDWSRTNALPDALQRRFKAEPNYLDLCWARADTDLSVRRPKFLDSIASLSSTLRNVPLDDLIGEDIAHFRTTRRLLRSAIIALVILTASAFYAAYLANQAKNLAEHLEADRVQKIAAEQRAADEKARQAEARRLEEAEQQRNAANSSRLSEAASSVLSKDRELSTLLAMEAVQLSPSSEAQDALRNALMKRTAPVLLHGAENLAVENTAFSSDGRRLLAVFEDGSVRIWTTTSPAKPIVLPAAAVVFRGADGTRAVFSPDGSTILTVPYRSLRTFLEPEGAGAAARIWDAGTGQLRRELKHPYVQDGAFSPDGRRVVTVSDDRTVVIWDAESGARLTEVKDHESSVVSINFSKDGKIFVAADKDNTVHIHSASDGNTLAMLHPTGESILTNAILSPDGRWILTLNRRDPPRLWDWQKAPGSSAAQLNGHMGSVNVAAFSPDSKLLVTVGNDNSARLWQVESGRNLYELAHDDAVSDAVFSSDGRWILTTSIDNKAILWDASSGKRIMDFGGYDRPRSSAAFSPDGSRVATGTASGQVLLYSCDVCGTAEQLLSLARTRVSRKLTPEERTRYLRPN